MDDKSKILAKNKFTLFLNSKKLRKTPERFTILEKIFSLNKHFEVDTLHEMLEEDSFHVSKATIYNTINLLIECGLVRKYSFDNQQAKYGKVNSNTTNHHYLICTECGKIKDIKDLEFSAYMNARKYSSFTTKYFQLYVYGVCNNCVRKIKRKSNK
ncbi:MAG: transcriptional repressor [Muribaculaceae bacterium]|jgi:Fur family ferric uptake transcriptional regulator|nr:transcriptional repressor [Muribaculaceae bacterium]